MRAGLVLARRTQAVARLGQRVRRGDVAHAGVDQPGARAERLMVPVGAAAVTRDRQDRDVPVRGVQAAALVVGHGAVRVAGHRGAERLIDDAGLGPCALARERLRRPALLPRRPAGLALRRCPAARCRRGDRGCSTCPTCCRRPPPCDRAPWIFTSTSTGDMTLSMSQMSWWIDWKCHLYAPVFRSSATIELANRFSPPRVEPFCDEPRAHVAEGPVDDARARDRSPGESTAWRRPCLPGVAAPGVVAESRRGRGTPKKCHSMSPLVASSDSAAPRLPSLVPMYSRLSW